MITICNTYNSFFVSLLACFEAIIVVKFFQYTYDILKAMFAFLPITFVKFILHSKALNFS